MSEIWKVLKEQLHSLPLIIRLAIYETRSKYQQHYLGVLWQWLNPLIQVLAYWFVFGFGIRKGQPVGEHSFIIWMLGGMIAWFFVSPTVVEASNSVFKRIKMVSKMNFPVSSLPSVVITSNLFIHIIMVLIYIIILLCSGVLPSLHWLQFFYYFICLILFTFSITLLNSTISVLIRDYQQILQALTRLLFFITPLFWDPSQMSEPVQTLLKLNPIYYIVDGYRNSFLNGYWFFEDIWYMLYFWLLTLTLLLLGSILHLKFRDKFVDFL
ncbi:ABC transporter permease [Niallia taxi]|uniref:ABC transporter permease n=1 Tax=Niallia taxi TaxID=2499688 RepID=UPI002E1E4426|nr:ABC transporter permease [Niallia taxi]